MSVDAQYDAVWNAVETVRLWVREQDDMDSETTIGQITDAFGGYMATGSPDGIRTRHPRVDAPAEDVIDPRYPNAFRLPSAPAAASEPEECETCHGLGEVRGHMCPTCHNGADDDDTQDPRKQARPHRERIDDLVTRADALSGRFDIHMRQIAALNERLTQVTNSFTGNREWQRKTAIYTDSMFAELQRRITALESTDDPEHDDDMHNSLAEMVHALDERIDDCEANTGRRGMDAVLEGKRLDDLDSRFADHMEKIQFVLDTVHRNEGETLEKIQRIEASIEELRLTALESTDDPEHDDEIERVAIAIYVASGEHVVDASAETWKDYHPVQQEDYRRLAKAALKAQGRQSVNVTVDSCLERVRRLIFSERKRFWEELQRRSSKDSQFVVSWPDVLLCVEVEDWESSLRVVGGGEG